MSAQVEAAGFHVEPPPAFMARFTALEAAAGRHPPPVELLASTQAAGWLTGWLRVGRRVVVRRAFLRGDVGDAWSRLADVLHERAGKR